MTLVRRLLMGGGGGGFVPVLPTVEAVASGGCVSTVSSPGAVSSGGVAYLGWVDGATGDVRVCSWDGTTAGAAVTLHAALGGVLGNPDLHDSPGLLVCSDGHMLVSYSAHQGAHMLSRRSTATLASDPTLASGFDAEVSIGAAGQYTYASLVESAAGWTYLLCRSLTGGTGSLALFYSTDHGATWLTPAHPLVAQVSGKVVYWKVDPGASGSSRIDVAITDTDRSDADPSSLYHFYIGLTGTTLDGAYATDGTLISAYASFPFAVTSATLVKGTSDGPVAAEDVTLSGGAPAIAMFTYASGDDTDRVARWTGSAWRVDAVGAKGGLLAGNRFQLGACFGATPDTLYSPHLSGSVFELRRWDSPDSGATWSATPLTYGSAQDNFEVQRIVGGTAVFARGAYTSDTSFSASLRTVR